MSRPAGHRCAEDMAVVAGEQFIAAIAAEADGQLLARSPGQQDSREHRRVGERLVPDGGQLWDQVERIGERQVDRLMIRSEMSGDRCGVARLVESEFGHRDGEGSERAVRLRSLSQRRDQRGIDSSGQEGPERHVALESHRHRIGEESLQLFCGVVEGEV